jgi:hypothetical protein
MEHFSYSKQNKTELTTLHRKRNPDTIKIKQNLKDRVIGPQPTPWRYSYWCVGSRPLYLILQMAAGAHT